MRTLFETETLELLPFDDVLDMTETFELLPFDYVHDIKYIFAFHARSKMKVYL